MLALLQTMRRAVRAVILITLAALAVTRTGGGPVAAQPSAAGAALPTNPVADPHAASVQWFAPTGHTLRGTFLAYWNAHGALAPFGYPITEEFQELSPLDHQPYTVQYFERSRFEHHPEHAGTPYEVELGLLGLAIAQQQGYFP